MADCPTFQDLFRVARDEVLIRNKRYTLAAINRRGSDINALTAAGVAVGDAVMGRLIKYNADLFLDSARREALDKLVWDRYRLLRQKASPAFCEATLRFSSPVVNAFTVPVNTPVLTSDGRVFNTTAEQVVPAGTSTDIAIPVRSALSGASQQIRIGTITSIQLTAAPLSIMTVTNLVASAGAADEEGDETFRARAKAFYRTSQRGTLPAIARRAVEVPGVRSAAAYDVVNGDGSAARLVQVVVTDQYTQDLQDATVLPGGYQTQAAQLALLVKSSLSDTRAGGIQTDVVMAQIRTLGVTLLLRFRVNVNVTTTAAAARARAVSYTNSLAPGQTWEPEALEQLLAGVPGLEVLGGEVVSPSSPQPAGILQAWRTSDSLVVIGNV
jgi:hypothetical protein